VNRHSHLSGADIAARKRTADVRSDCDRNRDTCRPNDVSFHLVPAQWNRPAASDTGAQVIRVARLDVAICDEMARTPTARFDRFSPVQHPRVVVILVRRASAVVALLAMVVGNIAVCAGWQATPEARMACCMDGTTCPMHKSDSHEHSSKRVVSQAQADSCCAAAAQRHDSAAAGSTFTASGVIALVPVTVLTVPTGPITSQEWRALVPLPVSSTPKHLLLSVFLV
jgi:hypothetical protein